MYNENQLVEVKWSAKTRKHYESKGYRFTNYGDAFLVKAKDLLNSSKYNIEVICDFCGKAYYPTILNFNRRANKNVDSFDDCRDKKCLPFDFYLPDYNLIIEFDGQIHYWEVGYGNHDITVAHDKIKNEYCKSHNIDIIRIPYWDGNDIEKIIATKLNL